MAVEEGEVEKVETVVEHRDDVNNDVAAAIASLKGEDDEGSNRSGNTDSDVNDDGTVAPDAVSDARPRDAGGKFVAKSEAETNTKNEGAPEKVAAPEPKLPPAESVAKASEQPSTAALAPPVSWAADAKTAWASLSPAVQNAVLKREQEASNGIRQYSEQVKLYERAISPIAQEAQRRGLSTEEGIQRLLDGQRFFEAQPAQAILWLSKQHGIDLAELASNPPAIQQQARPDPAFAQVNQTVQSLQERLQQIEFGNNLTVAQQFAASKPYYVDVEEQLPDFIREVQRIDPSLQGLALLEKAYERAVWLNPDVRAKVQAAERAEAEKARLADVQAKAQQASKAAVSVKGSSAPAAPAKRAPAAEGDTVYDAVRASIHQLRAG